MTTSTALPRQSYVPAPVPQDAVDRIVAAALAEDAPWGDITSELLVPVEARASAVLTAREPGIFCGTQVIEAAFRLASAQTSVQFPVRDGESFEAGTVLAEISGPARAVLTGERVALNLAQRLSGIATLTAAFVAQAAGTSARITDTRKTTPGLRILERHAVRCGGGHNHRFSLSDAVMAKDNHLALLAAGNMDLAQALAAAKAGLPHTVHFEVEVDRLDQIEAALAGGADTVLLDNFSPADLCRGVELIGGRALTEASGNVRLETVAEIAATGVDLISAGALTHSVRALDLGLDLR
ncbi:carboxylating nicotinate-nucleotide diphosphorylase [Arthrobacter sunyaminii]|uniref:Nicotinate-nucleotide pyrophosphorylase [carboxylating] n=1 Tax=Arthrobacter sunyaminii TaxID=2816859 RepID=A0A975XMX4_9MICC|nr:carboxylating nicotinate-nucleotide diphosphorylase [Arthrobacter sunyaminii]MBO0909205.1 carboxylating nicotinate-nucleotide diphosphorylase [Arthrobacter sunyaminii]QWQ38048.1 carboxylating nicotinate-nucleotide diphosphorylase [Arthrobacter sunyaminii]